MEAAAQRSVNQLIDFNKLAGLPPPGATRWIAAQQKISSALTHHFITDNRPQGLRPSDGRVGGCASPTSYATPPSAQAIHQLTFKVDQSVGADQ